MSGVSWLPPLEVMPQPCGCCPPRPKTVPLRHNPHPGFGCVALLCDGETVESVFDPEESWTFIHYENVAKRDPEHDWRVRVEGPMCGVVYQRQGAKTWVAVEKLEGFA